MIIKILKALKVLDDDGTLSLSNISLAIALFLTAKDPGRESIFVLLLVLLNFNAKKVFSHLSQRKHIGDQQRLSAIDAEIIRLQKEFEKLNAASTFTKLGR